MECDRFPCDYVEIIENQAKKEIQVKLHRIARDLKIELDDFKTIDKDKMTVELGENLRVQMRNIFRILRENKVPL